MNLALMVNKFLRCMSLTLKKSKTTNARIGMNMKTELIQGAIFDMDGTLLDSMPVWEHASERYLQNKGIEVREKLSEILFSMSMQKGAEYVKENYHLTESTDEIVTGVNNIVYTACAAAASRSRCVARSTVSCSRPSRSIRRSISRSGLKPEPE